VDTSVPAGATSSGWAAADGGATGGAVVVGTAADSGADLGVVGEEVPGGEVVVLPPEVSARLAAVPPTPTRAISATAPIIAPSRRRVKTLFKNAFMMDPSLCPDQSVDSKCQWTISHLLRKREGVGIAAAGSSPDVPANAPSPKVLGILLRPLPSGPRRQRIPLQCVRGGCAASQVGVRIRA
jgi:hypothetical protein